MLRIFHVCVHLHFISLRVSSITSKLVGSFSYVLKHIRNSVFAPRFSFYGPAQSLAEAMEEMFDITFPPSRYHYPRYLRLHEQPSQAIQQRQKLQRLRSEDSNKLVVAQLDVSHYTPEEVNCKVEDGKVVVTGKHYSENEYGYDSIEFHRSYKLPEDVDPLSVKSRISRDGILQIEVTKEQPKPSFVGVDETDDKKVSLKINLGSYKPEEVNVRVKGNELMVTAEQKSEEEGHFSHRRYKKVFALPEEVETSTLVSRFSKDGTLSIEAEKKDVPAIEEKQIEVQQEEMNGGDE